ncbi:hypothetical protein F5883DRAFT_711500 [Diaporthe sp. PMI_573]|nr:hypothetical protein F5883DRAFT_711500 [Diaporthaceae sp. PMI_573]
MSFIQVSSALFQREIDMEHYWGPSAQIKQEPNKSGGGEGQWSAWKASKLAKEYEKQGGGYENEPKKGDPEPKSDSRKKKETED